MHAELGPFYAQVCEELGWTVDEARLADMSAANKKHIEELEAKITDAKENLGDTEVKTALLAKADYLCKIGVQTPKAPGCLSRSLGSYGKPVKGQECMSEPDPDHARNHARPCFGCFAQASACLKCTGSAAWQGQSATLLSSLQP